MEILHSDLPEEVIAGYDYVDSVLDTADDKKNLMWHGWALRAAFIAGAKWQQGRPLPYHVCKDFEQGQPFKDER